MDIKNFRDVIRNITINHKIKEADYSYDLIYIEPPNSTKKITPYFRDERIPKEEGIYFKWITGGANGGNCWDDTRPESYSSNQHYDQIPVLDEIVSAIYPDIKYMQYKEIGSLVERKIFSENEYYGNYTSYSSLYIKTDDFYKILNKFGAFKEMEKERNLLPKY